MFLSVENGIKKSNNQFSALSDFHMLDSTEREGSDSSLVSGVVMFVFSDIWLRESDISRGQWNNLEFIQPFSSKKINK